MLKPIPPRDFELGAAQIWETPRRLVSTNRIRSRLAFQSKGEISSKLMDAVKLEQPFLLATGI